MERVLSNPHHLNGQPAPLNNRLHPTSRETGHCDNGNDVTISASPHVSEPIADAPSLITTTNALCNHYNTTNNHQSARSVKLSTDSSRPPSPYLDFASAVSTLVQQVNLMVERDRSQRFLGRPARDVDWDNILAYRSQKGIRNRSRSRFLAAATANLPGRGSKHGPRPGYRSFGTVHRSHLDPSIEHPSENSPTPTTDDHSLIDDSGTTTSQIYKERQLSPSVNPGRTSPVAEWDEPTPLPPRFKGAWRLPWQDTTSGWHEQSPSPLTPNPARTAFSPSYRELTPSPVQQPTPKSADRYLRINFPRLSPSPTADIEERRLGVCWRERPTLERAYHSTNRLTASFDAEYLPMVGTQPDIGRMRRSCNRPVNSCTGSLHDANLHDDDDDDGT